MLIRSISDYAVRQIKGGVMPPTPAHILLAYVPSADEERLLREFEFFVFPVRLQLLAGFDEHGRQLRNNPAFAEQHVLSCLELTLPVLSEVKRRLSSASYREPLFLPPQNFRVSDQERMADVYREITREQSPWSDPDSAAPACDGSKAGSAKKTAAGARKQVFSDDRGLLFPDVSRISCKRGSVFHWKVLL
jgi:hypothetical protein